MCKLDYSRQEEECKDFKKQTEDKECTYMREWKKGLCSCIIKRPCLCPFFTLISEEVEVNE